MTPLLVCLYVVATCLAAVIYPEELERSGARPEGWLDLLVLALAVVLWPIPLLVLGWLAARQRYRTWRNPVPATPEESHDER